MKTCEICEYNEVADIDTNICEDCNYEMRISSESDQ